MCDKRDHLAVVFEKRLVEMLERPNVYPFYGTIRQELQRLCHRHEFGAVNGAFGFQAFDKSGMVPIEAVEVRFVGVGTDCMIGCLLFVVGEYRRQQCLRCDSIGAHRRETSGIDMNTGPRLP